jgi:photosystem II stability/assembly factor-like uncharacterized protein
MDVRRGLKAALGLVLVLPWLVECRPRPKSWSGTGSAATHVDASPTNPSFDPHFRPVGPGGGGALFAPAISPHDPRRLLVACDMTGSYISHDGGESWRMFNLQGQVRFFVFDPKDRNVLYAASVGLWRSTNGGETWNLIDPDPERVTAIQQTSDDAEVSLVTASPHGAVTALAVDPGDSKTLYAARQQAGTYVAVESEDWGKSWQNLASLPGPALRVAVDPHSPAGDRTLYVVGTNFVSVREHGQWLKRSPPPGVESLASTSAGVSVGFSAQAAVLLYAAGPSGLLVSRDGGATWGKSELPGTGATVRAVAASPKDPRIAYVSYKNLQDGFFFTKTTSLGVARTGDEGKTWQLVWNESSQPAANIHEAWMSPFFGPGNPDSPLDMAVSEQDSDLVYTTDYGRVLRTSDAGKSWQAVYSTRRDDGTFVTRGLENTTNYGVHFDPFDPLRMFISYTDIGPFRSENGGESWVPSKNGIPAKWRNTTYWMLFDPAVRGRMWAATSGQHDLPEPKTWRKKSPSAWEGGICLSEDGGQTWRPSNAGMPPAATTHILLDPSSPPESRVLYVAAMGRGVYKSTDAGKTWALKNSGIPGKEPFAYRLTLDPARTLYLVVARRSTDGSFGNDEDGALLRSTDGAEHWTRITLPSGVNGPRGLAVDAQNPKRLYLAAWGRNLPHQSQGGGIYISEDAGKSWKASWTRDQHVYDISVDPKRPEVVYAAGYESAIWRSVDRGKTWKRIRGFNFKWANRVIPDPQHEDLIYITTFGGGVWHGPAAGDPSAADEIATPLVAHGTVPVRR